MLPKIHTDLVKAVWDSSFSLRDYHSNRNSLSSTGLKPLEKSPLEFYESWTNQEKKKQTEAMRFGTLVHDYIQRVLIYGEDPAIVPEFGDLRSSVNRKKKEDWHFAHTESDDPRLLIDSEDLIRVKRIEANLTKNQKFKALIKKGNAEHSGFFKDPATDILCRIRPDFHNTQYNILLDWKTCQDVSKDAVSKAIWDWKYHLSAYFYMNGVKEITGEMPNKFVFVFIETIAPFDVVLYEADESMIARGKADFERLMNKLKVCLLENNWHGVGTELDNGKWVEKIQTIGLPAWVK